MGKARLSLWQFLGCHCQTVRQIAMGKALRWASDTPKLWALLQGSFLVCIQDVCTGTVQGGV